MNNNYIDGIKVDNDQCYSYKDLLKNSVLVLMCKMDCEKQCCFYDEQCRNNV